jgi:hypothetical protein
MSEGNQGQDQGKPAGSGPEPAPGQTPRPGGVPGGPRPGAKAGGRDTGGVFVMGALLLAGVVIVVALFWGKLLKRPEANRPQPPEEVPSVRPSR